MKIVFETMCILDFFDAMDINSPCYNELAELFIFSVKNKNFYLLFFEIDWLTMEVKKICL